MNAQMCVPVSVIAQFHKIQQLTSDTGLIVESMKASTVCAVTPDGIKPSIKQERNTIILREIPSETSEEKVRCFTFCEWVLSLSHASSFHLLLRSSVLYGVGACFLCTLHIGGAQTFPPPLPEISLGKHEVVKAYLH